MNPPENHPEDEIQKMLALKRHEQPPPAFFQGFSGRVLDRIQSDPAARPTWRQKLSVEFYGVPLYVSLAGVVVCGLLVAGLISSLRVKPPAPMVASGEAHGPLGSEQPTHAIIPPAQPVSWPSHPDSAGTTGGNGTGSGTGSLELQPVRASLQGTPAATPK